MGIFLFIRDLRLSDNPAFYHLLQRTNSIIPLYVLDQTTENEKSFGAAQKWWLHHSLLSLSNDIKKAGSRLIIRQGKISDEVLKLAQEAGASHVYLNRCYDPYMIQEISNLEKKLSLNQIELKTFKANLLFEPWEIKSKTGGCFKVFTPFWKSCLNTENERTIYPLIKKIPPLSDEIISEKLEHLSLLPTKPDWSISFKDEWVPGQSGARKRLKEFLEKTGMNYHQNRDFPGINGTSRLSPHLHFGEITPLQIMTEIEQHRINNDLALLPEDVNVFHRELGWREFNYHLLHHFPNLAHQNFNAKFNSFPWNSVSENFKKWCRGQTGYPIVDAGMRQLWKTGWMHNRVRMITASFLVKDLLIDWRLGEQWFWDTLLDADHASNPANWQWVAGCGADAAPYFRIFNPVLQSEKFDPSGTYIREWIPEIQNLPDKYIHCPFQAPPNILERAEITLGKTYPFPLVDHKKARQFALACYKNS